MKRKEPLKAVRVCITIPAELISTAKTRQRHHYAHSFSAWIASLIRRDMRDHIRAVNHHKRTKLKLKTAHSTPYKLKLITHNPNK